MRFFGTFLIFTLAGCASALPSRNPSSETCDKTNIQRSRAPTISISRAKKAVRITLAEPELSPLPKGFPAFTRATIEASREELESEFRTAEEGIEFYMELFSAIERLPSGLLENFCLDSTQEVDRFEPVSRTIFTAKTRLHLPRSSHFGAKSPSAKIRFWVH